MTRGRAILLVASAPLWVALGCGSPDLEPDCSEDRCDAATSRDEVLAQIDGFQDPIAEMLRTLTSDAGTIDGDFELVLDELGQIVGCDETTEKSFVVLSNTDFIPKTVFARCADSPQAASRFFVAAPTITGDDMDPRSLHLTGWDDDAKKYRHYATAPTKDGGMNINVEPTFCLGCHGGPEELREWQPLMNEMTNPWSGWNAEPGFQSQLFDEYLDQDVATGDVYNAMLSDSRLDSASSLEPLIRAGISRTVSGRVLTRNAAPSPDVALDLIRPLFCDETVNYVSEVHRSGELRLDAIVDEGLRDLLVSLNPDAEWAWRNEDSTLLAPLEAGDDPVTLIATRATISVELERALIARGVLDELDLLRLRSIDWQTPIGSDARCDLFRQGRTDIEAGALDEAAAMLPSDATSADLLPLYIDHMLRDHSRPTPADAATLGAEVDSYIRSFAAPAGRADLRDARDARGCWANALFLGAPIIPDLNCP